MTQGVLLFASNNDLIKYTDIAEECARRCQKYLNKPISVITSTPEQIKNPQIFDKIIAIADDQLGNVKKFYNGLEETNSQWKNYSRADAWQLTPYDETLVIDVDYFLYTDILNYCFNQPNDLVVAKTSQDLSYWRDSSEFKYLGLTQLDFYWATVFFFRKTADTKTFFDLISHIKDNWTFYKQKYQFSSRLYRNDFSFTIAVHLLKDLVADLPFDLHYITDRDTVIAISDKACKALIQRQRKSNEYVISDIRDIDLHIMNKIALQELVSV
jgi:hypothetical protein